MLAHWALVVGELGPFLESVMDAEVSLLFFCHEIVMFASPPLDSFNLENAYMILISVSPPLSLLAFPSDLQSRLSISSQLLSPLIFSYHLCLILHHAPHLLLYPLPSYTPTILLYLSPSLYLYLYLSCDS